MFNFPNISCMLEPEKYFLFAGCNISHVLPLDQAYQWGKHLLIFCHLDLPFSKETWFGAPLIVPV